MTYELEVKPDPAQTAAPAAIYEALIEWLELNHQEYVESAWNAGGGLSNSLLLYFTTNDAAENLARALHQQFGARISLTIRQLTDAAWRDSWQANFTDLRTQRFHVQLTSSVPAPQDPPTHNHTIFTISLQPGAAFGRGDHATTEAMLRLMEKHLPHVLAERDFLDVGTGTGVLSIAAAHLGYQRIVATEIDSNVLEEARTNLGAHAITTTLKYCERTNDLGEFAVVVCNILSGALFDLLPDLQRNLRPGGLLFLSGFIEKELPAFRQRLNELGLEEQDIHIVRGWVGLCAG